MCNSPLSTLEETPITFLAHTQVYLDTSVISTIRPKGGTLPWTETPDLEDETLVFQPG